MKFTIAYVEEERQEAEDDLALLLRHHPDAKVNRSDRHTPYRHIYMTVPHLRNPGGPSNFKKTPCVTPRKVV